MKASNWRIALLVVAVAAVLVAAIGGWWAFTDSASQPTAAVSDAGLGVFASGAADCSRLPDPNGATACLSDLVLATTPILGTPTVYAAALAAVNANPAKFAEQCHRTFHYLGELTGRKTADVDKALALGGPDCQFGYFHGVVEGHAAETPTLWEELPTLCGHLSDDPTSNVYQECSHSLGHAIVTRTLDNVPEGLEKCRLLPVSTEQSACSTGVFMSWSNALDKRLEAGEPLDGVWAWAPPGKRYVNCTEFDDVVAGACNLFFAETVEHTVAGLSAFRSWCSDVFYGRQLPLENCHAGVGRVTGGPTEFKRLGEWPGIIRLCVEGYDYAWGSICAEAAYAVASGFQSGNSSMANEVCAAWEGSPHAAEECATARAIFRNVNAALGVESGSASTSSGTAAG